MSFLYLVRIAIQDRRVFDGFVTWLADVHLADVCASGADDALLLAVDVPAGDPFVVEAHYRFASREAFQIYERDQAPRLRALGLAELTRLGATPDAGVTFQRTTGVSLPWAR